MKDAIIANLRKGWCQRYTFADINGMAISVFRVEDKELEPAKCCLRGAVLLAVGFDYSKYRPIADKLHAGAEYGNFMFFNDRASSVDEVINLVEKAL